VVSVARYEERLRRLALHDEAFIKTVLAMDADSVEASGLDPKTYALVRLAAFLGAGAAGASADYGVTAALAAGAAADEVVGVLITVAPIIGIARAIPAATTIAIPLSYDIDAALEALDGPQRRLRQPRPG
jgi:4-carboxymuconolactone decarboxylase